MSAVYVLITILLIVGIGLLVMFIVNPCILEGKKRYKCPNMDKVVCAHPGTNWGAQCVANDCEMLGKQNYKCPNSNNVVCAYSGTNWMAQCNALERM